MQAHLPGARVAVNSVGFDGCVEEDFVDYLVACFRECPCAVVLVSGLASASSESHSSAGAVWVSGLEQTVVLGSVDVEVP